MHTPTTTDPPVPSYNLTPERLLLFLTRIQTHLHTHSLSRTLLFLTTYTLHTALIPIPTAPTASQLIYALLLWSTYTFLTTTPWHTATLIIPFLLALTTRILLLLFHPILALLLGLPSIYLWSHSPATARYASGAWTTHALQQALIQRLWSLQATHERTTRAFASQMLAWLLSDVGSNGTHLHLRRPQEPVNKSLIPLWTPARLLIFRPTPTELRQHLWPSFDKFVERGRRVVEEVLADVAAYNDEDVTGMRELGVRRERLVFLVEQTEMVWEWLYAELVHTEGKEEGGRRPRVGEEMPKRLGKVVRWFVLVEEMGVDMIVAEERPKESGVEAGEKG